MNKVRRIRNRRDGTAIVETAMVLPVFVLFLFGVLEYGRFVMVKNLFDNAVREGARFAVVHTADKTTTDVQDTTAYYLSTQAGELEGFNKYSNIEVFRVSPTETNPANPTNTGLDWRDAKFGESICVRITGVYRPIALGPLFTTSAMTLTTQSVMLSEAN